MNELLPTKTTYMSERQGHKTSVGAHQECLWHLLSKLGIYTERFKPFMTHVQ